MHFWIRFPVKILYEGFCQNKTIFSPCQTPFLRDVYDFALIPNQTSESGLSKSSRWEEGIILQNSICTSSEQLDLLGRGMLTAYNCSSARCLKVTLHTKPANLGTESRVDAGESFFPQGYIICGEFCK